MYPPLNWIKQIEPALVSRLEIAEEKRITLSFTPPEDVAAGRYEVRVSGVASLFSTEFYNTIKRHLTDDGLFVQWIQLYEFNDQLAESILKALSINFSDYVIYTTDGANILLIARNKGDLPSPDWSVLFAGGMGPELAKIYINSGSDLEIRRLVNRDSIVPYLRRTTTPINSDYFPYVDLNAGSARYKQSQSRMFASLTTVPLPVIEMLNGHSVRYSELTRDTFVPRIDEHENADWMYRRIAEQASAGELGGNGAHMKPEYLFLTDAVQTGIQFCTAERHSPRFRFSVHRIFGATLPLLDSDQGIALVDSVAEDNCGIEKDREALLWLDLYRAVARRDATEMSSGARRLLAEDAKSPAILDSYLVTAAMLGDIADGKSERALVVWNTWGREAFADNPLPVYMKLISSIAMDANAPAASAATSR